MTVLPAYDTTKVESLSLTPDQFGQGLATWRDKTLPYTMLDTDMLGISFDFSTTNESEGGLVLAPKIPFTAATNDLAGTGETSKTWTLTISTNTNVKVDTPGSLYGITSPNPDPWSASYKPVTVYNTSNQSKFLIEAIDSNSSAWVLSGGVYHLVWNLDFLTNYTESGSGPAVIKSPLCKVVNNSLWNGTIQFIWARATEPEAPATYVITAVTFTGYTHKWHTGMSGAQMDLRGRAVHDYITGQPYMSTSAVEDGYREGVMVHPDNYDPADPLDTDFFTPPPGEGVTDDDITNLE